MPTPHIAVDRREPKQDQCNYLADADADADAGAVGRRWRHA
jgi:hypothetical protein